MLATLRDLARRDLPLITLTEAEGGAPKAIAALTPAGENVMKCSVDDLEINTPDRWLGGAHLTRKEIFRWDELQKRVIRASAVDSFPPGRHIESGSKHMER